MASRKRPPSRNTGEYFVKIPKYEENLSFEMKGSNYLEVEEFSHKHVQLFPGEQIKESPDSSEESPDSSEESSDSSEESQDSSERTPEKYAQLTDRVNDCSSPFADIPADIFLKICDYLDLADKCRAGRVCVRWYRLIRGEYIWSRTDIASLNLTQENHQKLLTSLPPSVNHLRIGFPPYSTRRLMKLPALFYQIQERCSPTSLIIENSLLQRSDVVYVAKSGYMLNCKTPVKDQVNRWFLDLEYAADNPDGEFVPLYHHFLALKVLSLRFSVFAVEDIFPREINAKPESKIEVLDLTLCPSTLDKNTAWFCRLPLLEELYLSGTAVTINGVLVILKSLRHLKVLDLDETVVGGETFSVLKRLGGKLVHIYMGGTAVKDDDLVDIDANCFPNLRKICLRRTCVTEIGIQILVNSLPSLKCILVPRSNFSLGWLLDQSPRIREKLVIASETERDVRDCNHFFENRYKGHF